MAKRKKHRKTGHARKSHPSLSRRHPRRRRRMSAGGGAFKLLSDPLIGGIAGGIAGILVKKLGSKFAKDNALIGTAIPVVAGFLLKKKMPFVAAGMVAGPVVALLAQKITFLQEDNALFVDQNLLNDPSPLFLSEDGEELYLSDQGYSLNDDAEYVPYTYMNDDED